MDRPSARRAFLAAGAVAVAFTAASAADPEWGGWLLGSADAPYLFLGLLTTVALVVAARRSTGDTRRAWTILAVGLGLNALGDIAFVIVDRLGDGASVSPVDALYLASYLFFGAALWTLGRGRNPSSVNRAVIDGVALAAGLGLLVWQAVIVAPGGLESAGSLVDQLVLVAYPLLDLVLLAGLATLMLSNPWREPALWGLFGFVALYLSADIAYAVTSNAAEGLVPWTDCVFGLSYLALGWAALHPSARTLAEPVPRADSGPGRFLVLGLSMAAPGVTAAFAVAITGGVNTPVLISTTTVIAALLTARVAMTMQGESAARVAAEEARAKLAERMRIDVLTGLPNRAALLARLDEVLTGTPPALLFVDLDRFKVVNDTAGHSTGDRVLRQAAERIRDAVGSDDEVYRLAGDEFIVLCPTTTDVATAEGTAGRIIEAFGPAFAVGDLEWFVGASVGVALGRADDATDPERLLRDADLAMYEAKRDGRRTVRLFDTGMRERLQRRHDLEISLRHAVERGEIQPAFQPVVALDGREIVGFEALARWRRQAGVDVPAEEFIAVAEHTGLVAEIDTYMLQRACHFVRQWNEQRPDRAPAWVSVNVSTKELAAGDLAARVRRTLTDAGIPAGWLMIELTEGALSIDPDLAVRRLTAVRELGVGLAIDDFGSGFSSLAHLLRFPVDLIKIDRMFVASLSREGSHRSVAAAALRVASTLGIPAVAEGVETSEQAELLAELGYPLGQGYYFARPMPAADAARLAFGDRDDERVPAVPPSLR